MSIYHYDLGFQEGQPYMPGRRCWPQHVEYSGFRSDSHLLRMFMPSLTSQEIQDVRGGDAEFALVLKEDLILFLYRFGTSFPWSDAPYSWHMVPLEDREVPSPNPLMDPRDPLFVLLVEATTGIVQVVRKVWLSVDFTRELRQAIAVQSARPWPGDKHYNMQLQSLYHRFPTPESLLSLATTRTRAER